jgi:RNA polymerase sigma factor (TIGR02999 family)
MSDVTRILQAIDQGDPHAADQLLPLVYDELRHLAAAKLAQETPGQTLDPTGLVHEAYLRLVRPSLADASGSERQYADCRHFFAAAAEAMRRILIDNARRKKREKYGGQHQRVELRGQDVAGPDSLDETLVLDEALTRLAAEDPPAAEIVKLHFYSGLSIEEAAKALDISRATAYRHWTYARAWLRCALREAAPAASE